MAKSTSSSRAIRTMAWPCCRRRDGDLIAVLSQINRISSDDDVVADNLLYQWSKRLKVEPQRYLERLVPIRRHRVVAARWRWVIRQLAARSVRNAVAVRARVGDEDPTGVGRRQLRRADRVAVVRNRPIGAGVRRHLGHGMGLDCGLTVGVGWPVMLGPVPVAEVRGPRTTAWPFF